MDHDTISMLMIGCVIFSLLLIHFLWRAISRTEFRNPKFHGLLDNCKVCYASSHSRDRTCRWPEGNRTGNWEYNTDLEA